MMTNLRILLVTLLLISQSAWSEPFDLDHELVKSFLASNENLSTRDIISSSDRKIAKKKLSKIVRTIRKNEEGKILGIKRNSDGYAVRLINNGRIRVIQVDQDGASIIW